VRVGGEDVRVLEKGDGEPVGVLAGLFGLRTWNHFLEALARRRRVVVPSLPGQPGGGDFRALDDLPDWIAATLDVLEAAELAGADLVGFGPGGALAAEVAVFAPGFVRRLALVAPFGLFDPAEPVTDVWAKRLSEVPGTYSARPDAFAGEVLACPAGEDAIEWQVEQVRALESAARLLWPTGDTGLSKRLHRIRCDTLLVWGAQDRVVPPSYAKRWSERLAARCAVHTVPGAGHRVDVDAPDALADAIAEFLDG
jgi:pimeloyl-ACP methyl ester carboxylesterase